MLGNRQILGSNWESFTYGETCLNRRQVPGEIPRRGKAGAWEKVDLRSERYASVLIIKVPIEISPSVSIQRSPLHSTVYAEEVPIDWGAKVKKTKEYLRLKDIEAAELLGVAPSTIYKIENGESQKPQEESIRRFNALFEIESLLNKHLRKKKYAVVAALRTSLSAFGNKTAIEFAKDRENGIFKVLGVLKRIYE